MSEQLNKSGLVFNFVKWYGFIISWMFILYGGVKILLGFLDNEPINSKGQEFIFLLLGIILLLICYAFRDLKNWGWYGLVTLNIFIILTSFINITDLLNIPLIICSVASLAALFWPPVKSQIFSR